FSRLPHHFKARHARLPPRAPPRDRGEALRARLVELKAEIAVRVAPERGRGAEPHLAIAAVEEPDERLDPRLLAEPAERGRDREPVVVVPLAAERRDERPDRARVADPPEQARGAARDVARAVRERLAERPDGGRPGVEEQRVRALGGDHVVRAEAGDGGEDLGGGGLGEGGVGGEEE